MRIELGFLRTRVARNLLVRFVVSALLPLGVLATISLFTVSGYLDDRSTQQLLGTAQGTELALSDRLAVAARDVELLADIARREASADAPVPIEAQARFPTVLSASAVGTLDGDLVLFGDPFLPPQLEQDQVRHLRDGKTLLVESGEGETAVLLMAHSIGSEPDEAGVLWARLDSRYLWGAAVQLAALSPEGGLCVLSADMRPLHGDTNDDPTFAEAVRSAIETRTATRFLWEGEDGPHRFVTRPVHLGPDYLSTDWHVVVSLPEAVVTAPLRGFTERFLPLVLGAFLVVLLLSNSQIRRTIRPLELIHDATQRIAADDFSGRLRIQSNDEFRDLAHSFNAMSDRLGKQIQTLTAISQVDRAALSARDPKEIVDALLQTLLNVVDCETVSVCTLDPETGASGMSYAVSQDSREVTVVQPFFCEGDTCSIPDEHVLLSGDERSRLGCLEVPPFGDHDFRRFLVLPLELDRRRAGLVCFASTNEAAFPADEVRRLRQIGDQATLALSNVDRLDELGRMSLGALTALARTIDANSRWTAGHSERVTLTAIAIAQRMGLDAEQIDALRRGALLHDIGKIGVPVEVLNKPAALTDEEFEQVKAHVTIGHRILEPIEAFHDLIPVVRHHHERMDGTGYPDGLVGEDIDLSARIVAVADTFDALTSDRPYRKGLAVRTAVEVIRNGAGTQLDPLVVEVFLQLLAEGALDYAHDRDDVVSRPVERAKPPAQKRRSREATPV